MKVGIMQPYFMPYIGYWQLMNEVDKYVVYDDVNYIKRGWINRNRILMDGMPKYINLPILGASQNKLINEIQVSDDKSLFNALLRTLRCAYGKAPYFNETITLMTSICSIKMSNLAEFLMESFYIIGEYLDIHTDIMLSSTIEKNNELRGQDKILEICEKLGATKYYNAIGGRELYNYADFAKRDIELKFLQTGTISYKQFGNEFQPNLSMIDVLMFNSKEEIKDMLKKFITVSE